MAASRKKPKVPGAKAGESLTDYMKRANASGANDRPVKAKAPSSSGPAVDKPANANSKPKTKSPAETRRSLTRDRSVNKPAPRAAADLSSYGEGDLRKKTLANGGVTPGEKPAKAADIKKGDLRSQTLKNKGVTPGRSASTAASTTTKAAGYGANAAKVLSYGSKLLGRFNPVIDQIASAKPLNAGEQEWIQNRYEGRKLRKAGAGTYTEPYDKPGPKKKYYDRVPQTDSGSGLSFGNTPLSSNRFNQSESSSPKTGYPTPSAAAPGSTSTFAGSKGSTTPSVVSPGTQTKRGAVTTAQSPGPRKLESRYQRDSGLAMDSRKRK